MRLRYRIFTATALVILSWSTLALADPSNLVNEGKNWSPVPTILADVPELEPNNSLATAQILGCGNVLRPASILPGVAPPDTDYVSFTANAGDRLTIGTDADGGVTVDTRIRLFNASGVVLAGDDDSGPGLYSLISGYVAPYTGTYYVGIAAFAVTQSGIYKAFVICCPAAAPANDVCAGAGRLACGPINESGSTFCYSDNYTPNPTTFGGCTGYSAFGRDLVYRIDANAGDFLGVTYTSTADGSIYLITNCANASGSCVAGADATLEGEPEELTYLFGTAGTYYLVVDSFGTNTSGDWTMVGALECSPVATERTSWGRVKVTYR